MASTSTFNPLPCRPRAGLLLAFCKGTARNSIAADIVETVAALHAALPEAEMIGTVTIQNRDALYATLGGRTIGRPFDGVIEIVLPAGQSMQRLHAAVPVLRENLADKLDENGCVANVGEAHFAHRELGPHALITQFHRARNTTSIDVMTWWTTDHIAMTLAGATNMGDYALQNRADPVSAEFSRALGFPDEGDIYESVFIRRLDKWIRAITLQLGRQGMADEVGRLSHETMRGEYVEVVARLGRTT